MQSYKPHDYQEYATNFILSHPACGLLLDMGLGKTVITLTALWSLLLDYFDVGRVLIIAIAVFTYQTMNFQNKWAGCIQQFKSCRQNFFMLRLTDSMGTHNNLPM